MSRLLPVTLLALLAGLLTQAPAKPPDLPIDTTVTCATAQEPEVPIDGLLIESVFEKPKCPVCDILVDIFFPPLRLRHIPAIVGCPCFQDCCKSLQETMAHCCASVKRYAAQANHGDTEEATEKAPATEEAEETGDNPPEGEVLDAMPQEETEQDDAAPEEAAEAPPKSRPDTPKCPYLERKACPSQAGAEDPGCASSGGICPPLAETPLDSFDRLMKGWHVYRKAEHCRAAGKMDRACHLYERAKKMCPGSRIERLACTRLEEIHAQKAAQDTMEHLREALRREPDLDAAPTVEEAEPLPCRPPTLHYDRLRAECLSIGDELRSKASALLEAGHYAEGYALAEMAIRFSSDCEDVFALLAKAQALLQPEKDTVCPEPATPEEAQEPEAGATDGEVIPPPQLEGEDTEVMPPADESPPDTGPQALVQPPLPRVDPAIVDALEKVLRESGDPTIPKLVIEVDEPAADEQADPVSTWPYVPLETDVPPSLLVDPGDDDLALEEDEDDAPSAEGMARAFIDDHLEEMLRDTLDALRQHVCCDVDIDGPNGPRGRVNFQIGGMQFTLVCDGWGHRLVVVRLTPEASGDLRALQEAHNDRVLHWIELMNSGGNSVDEDDDATAEDDEDDDLLYYDEPFPL
jgi:tetratricopeptide (TPR) repeat protein